MDARKGLRDDSRSGHSVVVLAGCPSSPGRFERDILEIHDRKSLDVSSNSTAKKNKWLLLLPNQRLSQPVSVLGDKDHGNTTKYIAQQSSPSDNDDSRN